MTEEISFVETCTDVQVAIMSSMATLGNRSRGRRNDRDLRRIVSSHGQNRSQTERSEKGASQEMTPAIWPTRDEIMLAQSIIPDLLIVKHALYDGEIRLAQDTIDELILKLKAI